MALQAIVKAHAGVRAAPHTYQTRDFRADAGGAHADAARHRRDRHQRTGSSATFTRPMFQGKLVAEVVRRRRPVLRHHPDRRVRADAVRRAVRRR
jgi:hypothetical protein